MNSLLIIKSKISIIQFTAGFLTGAEPAISQLDEFRLCTLFFFHTLKQVV